MSLVSFLTFLLVSLSVCAETIKLSPENLEVDLNDAIENSRGDTTIILPAGKFFFSNELFVNKPKITLKGQGPSQTILSFQNQKAGPQGVIATKDQVTFESLAIEDTAGNAVKVIGADQVTFRNVRVEWTHGPSQKNGAYGLYPVLCKNVLIENSEVIGASDAGIYVGQSRYIVIRNNKAHGNVAGIEIENSSQADVYGNFVEKNTAGILVFNLPDLVKKDGRGTRVFSNTIIKNNQDNFSTKGSIINMVPKGLGIFIIAAQETEIFNNKITKHGLSAIAVSNYAVSERKVHDPTFDPMPKGIFIYDNHFESDDYGFFDGSRINFIIKLLSGLSPKDIIYDGIDDGTYVGQKPEARNRICIGKNTTINGAVRFANLHLDHNQPHRPYPGGPASRSLREYDCSHPLQPVVLLENPPEIVKLPVEHTDDDVRKQCSARTEGVNWNAVDYDCPELSDYHLFLNPSDPTKNPVEGIKYGLSNQLFTDYAIKDRFVYVPAGKEITYMPKYALDFPVGSIISKSFSLQEYGGSEPTLVETRLLIRREKGWVPLNYIWKNGKATLMKAGLVKSVSINVNGKKMDIDYHIPSLRQCSSCHFINEKMTPIGMQAKHLNRADLMDSSINQLRMWEKKKMLKDLPADHSQVPMLVSWDDSKKDLDARAKSYLEINCAHCHNPSGNARSTGLFLQSHRDSGSIEYGACKTPVAAGFGSGGNKYDIRPGKAKESILAYRISNSHLAVKMPQLGRSVSHIEGNKLVFDWINQMADNDCK